MSKQAQSEATVVAERLTNRQCFQLWGSDNKYILCKCTDGKHDPKRINDTFETRKDAEYSRESGEHIVYVTVACYMAEAQEAK